MLEENALKTCKLEVCRTCKDICCQHAKPPLTQKRQKIMEDYLKKQKIRIESPFSHERYSFTSVDKLGFCLFYNKQTGKCLVHDVKPETCRAGPITFDINFQTGKVEWYMKTQEICGLARLLLGNRDSFRAHLDVAKEELLRLIYGLDAEALWVLLKIDEPQTFKIGEDYLPKEILEKLGACKFR